MKALDLRNQRFGRLVAREIAADKRPGAHWHCQCDCGQWVTASAGRLRAQRVRSCGCLGLETLRKNARRAAAKRWGNAVIEPIPDDDRPPQEFADKAWPRIRLAVRLLEQAWPWPMTMRGCGPSSSATR